MKQKFNRGFTLIELLVVIAIIGILSSVVLASLNTARGKGSNAAVKSNLNNLRAASELHYDDNGNSYATFCSSATVAAAQTSLASAGGGTVGTMNNDCNSNATAWAAYSDLRVAEGTLVSWCVDSTGASKGQTSAQRTTLGTTGTVCQ